VFHSPGFPVSDVPFDGGGPSTNAVLDTAGTSQALAIFPNPGAAGLSVPGAAAGLLGSGAGGLPPVSLPPLPAYPLQASSDASSVPEATAGEGPYTLRATSSDDASSASASAGGTSETAGNVTYAHSESSVATQTDGGVLAKAVSVVQGMAVGPLTIGEVASTATMRSDDSGRRTPLTEAHISGLRIGGQPVNVDAAGLNAGGVPIPLPVSEGMAAALADSGITVMLVPAQSTDDAAVAPAMVVTFPADLRPIGLGTSPGTFSITLGGASARLVTAGSSVGVAPGAVPGSLAPGVDSAGLGAPTLPSTAAGLPGAAGALPGSPTGLLVPAASSAFDFASFDLTDVYLFVVAGAVVALVLAHLTGLLGVRKPWTSDAG
jgi:hypothetical protein